MWETVNSVVWENAIFFIYCRCFGSANNQGPSLPLESP